MWSIDWIFDFHSEAGESNFQSQQNNTTVHINLDSSKQRRQ